MLVCVLGLHVWHREGEIKPQLPAYATATAVRDPSPACYLHRSSWQSWILNTMSGAKSWTASSWLLVGFLMAEPPRDLRVRCFYPERVFSFSSAFLYQWRWTWGFCCCCYSVNAVGFCLLNHPWRNSLLLQDKPNFIMVHNLLKVMLNCLLVSCWRFLHQYSWRVLSMVFFSCTVWLWFQGKAGLVDSVGKNSLPSDFLQEFEGDWG